MAKLKAEKAAVFLDRDGTINEDPGYLYRPEELAVIPGAAEAIRALNRAGMKVIVVSNQSGVGRGYFTDADVHAVNERLIEIIGQGGALIDAIYYCNHHPEDDCSCRKPKTGLVEAAATEHSIELSRSYVVGDKASDIELARNSGAKGVLVLTGRGGQEKDRLKAPADYVALNLADAVGWIIRDVEKASG